MIALPILLAAFEGLIRECVVRFRLRVWKRKDLRSDCYVLDAYGENWDADAVKVLI